MATIAQMREDLLVTALEGGSNYWYYLPDLSMVEKEHGVPLSIRMHKALMKGVEIPVHDAEDDEELLGMLSKKSIIEGEKIMKQDYREDYNAIISEDYDANTADIWFQLAVMKEIVFG